jgi:hypothetical protein
MLGIIGLGSSAGGAFALTPGNATSADSTLYAVLNVTRDGQRNYRIDEKMAGSKAKSPDTCRGYTTGSADDVSFGALLALETQKLVRCVLHVRGASSQ